jgi:hypothetical protein
MQAIEAAPFNLEVVGFSHEQIWDLMANAVGSEAEETESGHDEVGEDAYASCKSCIESLMHKTPAGRERRTKPGKEGRGQRGV